MNDDADFLGPMDDDFQETKKPPPKKFTYTKANQKSTIRKNEFSVSKEKPTKSSPSPKKVTSVNVAKEVITIEDSSDLDHTLKNNIINHPIDQLKKATTIDNKNWITSNKKLNFNEDIEAEFFKNDTKPSPAPPKPQIHTHSPAPSASVTLNKEQQRVIDVVKSGKNLFFTGCAGTGKSTVLRTIIQMLPAYSTFVTASTGIAAINIGGITLHSFSGIGLGDAPVDELVERISNGFHLTWWQRCKVLVIDEISMVDADLFDKLEVIARIVRKIKNPFGGIQLVICGDFFQLPPVGKAEEGEQKKFCFQAESWKKCVQVVIELKEVFRQADEVFVNVLNEIRHGYCSKASLDILMNCKNTELKPIDGIAPTKLYAHNKDVEDENLERLKEINEKGKLYKAKDVGREPFLQQLQAHCPVPLDFKVKIGAQVMLMKNLSIKQGLINGSRGVVIGFDDTRRGYPRVMFTDGVDRTIEPEKFTMNVNGQEVASRQQVPLRLAWALSIHKCQGCTVNRAEMYLGKVFEYGQAYSALSRVSSLEGLKLVDFNAKCIMANPDVIKFYQEFSVTNLPKDTVVSPKMDVPANYNSFTGFPFSVSYAASSRAKCRGCNNLIDQGQLRIGKMVQSKNFDGYFPLWFHLDCFSKKKDIKKPTETGELDGYDELKPEDQGKLIHMFKLKDVPPMIKSPKGKKAEMNTSITITPQKMDTIMPDLEEEETSQDNSFMKRLLMDEFQDEDFIPSVKPTTPPAVVKKPITPLIKTTTTSSSYTIGKQSCKYGLLCYRKNPDHFEEFTHPPDHPYYQRSPPPPPVPQQPLSKPNTSVAAMTNVISDPVLIQAFLATEVPIEEEENSMEKMPPPLKKIKLPDTVEDKSKEDDARKRQEEREILLERSRRERELEEIKEEEKRKKMKLLAQKTKDSSSSSSSQLNSFHAWQQNRSRELEKLLNTLKPSSL